MGLFLSGGVFRLLNKVASVKDNTHLKQRKFSVATDKKLGIERLLAAAATTSYHP